MISSIENGSRLESNLVLLVDPFSESIELWVPGGDLKFKVTNVTQ